MGAVRCCRQTASPSFYGEAIARDRIRERSGFEAVERRLSSLQYLPPFRLTSAPRSNVLSCACVTIPAPLPADLQLSVAPIWIFRLMPSVNPAAELNAAAHGCRRAACINAMPCAGRS